MKVLVLLAVALTLLTLVSHAKAAIGTAMKIEGSCSGTLVDGSPVSFVYYSNFNGCKKVNKAALTFTAETGRPSDTLSSQTVSHFHRCLWPFHRSS